LVGIAFVIGLVCGILVTWWAVRARRSGQARGDQHRTHAEAADRLAELATLTGGLAHEIRNPLSTLKVNLQLLSEDWRGADEAAESDLCRRSLSKIETLRGEADRLQEILDDFLRYIGRQELQPTRADLNDLVDDLLVFFRPQATAQKVQVRATLCAEPLTCNVDVAKFKQALLNLFVNAQQAMPDGGELMIRTSADAESRACIEVIDTGCGIAPDEMGRIFEPYFSTKREGTGLGLPTARRILRAHGGMIDAHAEPGRGTSFTLRLPLASGQERD